MKILVCVSKVPDTTTKISFTDNDTKFNNANVTWIMNPTDEWYALVRALELKETLGGTVTLIFDEGQPTIPLEEALTNDKYGWQINSEVAEVVENKFFKFYSDLGITIADIDIDYM